MTKRKRKYSGLGVSGFGKILRKKKGETMRKFGKRQMKEFLK